MCRRPLETAPRRWPVPYGILFLDRGELAVWTSNSEAYRIGGQRGHGRAAGRHPTFDLRADKDLSIRKARWASVKTNPALGMRAIRVSLARAEDVPDTGFAGHPATSKYGQVGSLIPMLARPRDRATLAAVEQAKSSLRGDKMGFDPSIRLAA